MAPSFSFPETQKEPPHMNFLSPLMGVNFRGADIRALVTDMQVGQTLGLERDPDNQYDSNAIKVIYSAEDEDHFVGFVAKEVAEELAPLLDAGYTATAKIIDFLGPIKPHLEIEASLAEEAEDPLGSDAPDEDDESEEDEDENESDEPADEAAPASFN